MILTIDINITQTLQWICWENRKSMAAYRVHALMSFQEVVLFCGTGFLVCHLHTSEVSHPQKKKSSLLPWKSAGGGRGNRILVLPYPSHFPFFFSRVCFASSWGQIQPHWSHTESFPTVSTRRTLDASGYILQKYAFRPWLRKALN